MSIAVQVGALRSSVGLSRASHLAMVHVAGPGAFELLQAVCAQTPYLRVGRVRSTLLLRDDATVLADVLVVNMGDWLYLVADGPDETALVAWLEAQRGRTSKEVTCRGMTEEWALYGADGPYAWELVQALLGRAVLGMPYLSLLPREDALCIRAGKTGEYGYLLAVPRPMADATWSSLVELGRTLDAAEVGVEALDVCALESWHFSMRMLRPTSFVSALTPLELQLQWRVGYGRDFVGAQALRARKAAGLAARVTCFVADATLPPGAPVLLDGEVIGEVLVAKHSPTVGVDVGCALLAAKLAHPHLDFVGRSATGEVRVRTQPAYMVENLSLHVHPHLGHTYATRGARP